MLDRSELVEVAARFGVGEEQVRRDHLVSHVLAGLSEVTPEAVFFGGTGLARTYLPAGRLSEDVDLYADDRRAVVRRLSQDLPGALRREFPGIRWAPAPDAVRQPGYALLVPEHGLPIRVQVLDGAGYRYWPTERRPVDVRYADVPRVDLVVPTRAAFVGMKLWAWAERHAPRDLYDLWALAAVGAVDGEAVATFARAVGWRPGPSLFDRLPDSEQWRVELAHQTAVLPESDEAAVAVRAALERALDE